MENLGFVLSCVGTIVLLFLIAWLFEKRVVKDRKAFSNTHYITYTAIFSALAGVLMFIEIPLFFAPSFYKIDLSEIPVLICTFYLGPVAGVAAELLKVMVKLLLKGTSTAFVGDFANFAVGCSLVLPASMVYHARPGRRSALIGMLIGTLVMTVFGSAEAIIGMGTKINPSITSVSTLVLFAVVPFNLLKGVIDSLLTFLLYKRISPILHRGDERRQKRRTAKEAA